MAPPQVVEPRVFVLDRRQQPLMPCHPARARQLLAAGRARVVRMFPFTIRLVDRLVADSEVQELEVKVDPGSKATGVALVRQDTAGALQGLFGVEVQHRGQQIHLKLTARSQYRRRRRSANLRYRQPRFDNRAKPQGWLPPSVRHRVESTLIQVGRLARLSPVGRVCMELVRFDLQQQENPEVTGAQYQQGTLFGFEVKEYLLAKYNRTCIYCDKTDVVLNVEHVLAKARGGSDRVSNLAIACVPCNLRKAALPVEVFLAKDPARLARIMAGLKRPLRDAAAVNTTRWALHKALTATGLPVTTGSGGLTKFNRTRLGIPKSHTLDALCVGPTIAVGSYPRVVAVEKATGRGVYCRTRTDTYGFPRLKLTRIKRHFGFATGDTVKAIVPKGKRRGTHVGRVAVRANGNFNITTEAGTVTDINYKNCVLISRSDGWGHLTQDEATMPTLNASPPGPKGPGSRHAKP